MDATRNAAEALALPGCLVIAGSSGTGKTTLLNALKASGLSDGVLNFPMRYVTRPPRDNDDFDENRHVSKSRFLSYVRAGHILLHWNRSIGPTRTEWYGFTEPAPYGVAVYSANNALFAGGTEVHPRSILNQAFVVGLCASDYIRERRLLSRSPRMMTDQEEASHRLRDRGRDVLLHADLVIDTSSGDAHKWTQEVIRRVAGWELRVRDGWQRKSASLSRLGPSGAQGAGLVT